MAFNLNKLVQPECGAPNPLVAAAQQIAMKPSAAPMPASSSTIYQYRQIRPQLNFAQEFTSQRELSNLSRLTSNTLQSTSKAMRSTSASTHSTTGLQNNMASQRQQHYQHHQHQHHHNQQQHDQYNNLMRQTMGANPILNYMPMMASSSSLNDLQHQHQETSSQMPTVLAGEQLETKYRNDMISQTTTSSSNLNHVAEGKLDDVEFWQSLSQQYLGPATFNNIAQLRAERAANSQVAGSSNGTATTSTSKAADDTMQEVTNRFEDLTTKDQIKFDNFDESAAAFDPSAAPMSLLNDFEYVFDERNPLKDQFEDPFSEGIKRLEQGDIPSAALLFEAAVQKEPDNSMAWRYLGTTQAQNEKDLSAIRALRNCLKLNQNDQEARLAISVSLVNETQHHEACKYLLEWLMNHERYKSVNANLKEFHLLDSELSNDPFYVNSIADKHYNYVRDKFVEAARMSPRDPDPEVQNSLGVLFNMRGDYDKAVDCFKAALSVRSQDSLLWNRLGATLANGNKSDEAVIAYRRALEIAPGFLRSRYNLAISLIHLNLYDEAAKQLVQILNMQAAGKGTKNAQVRTRSITSTSIWNALRTVATLLNQPNLYPMIDGRDLAKCNQHIFGPGNSSSAAAAAAGPAAGSSSAAPSSSGVEASN